MIKAIRPGPLRLALACMLALPWTAASQNLPVWNHDENSRSLQERLDWLNESWRMLVPEETRHPQVPTVASEKEATPPRLAGAPVEIKKPSLEPEFAPTLPKEPEPPMVEAKPLAEIKPEPMPSPPPLPPPEALAKITPSPPPPASEKVAAPPPPAAPASVPPGLASEMAAFVALWKGDWEKSAGSQGDVAAYVSHYDDSFTAEGMALPQWVQSKTQTNQKKKWIKVEIDDLRIETKQDRVLLSFLQNYTSSNYSHQSRKALEIQKTGGNWKIVSEK